MVGDQSELYMKHPDWVLHNSNGTPFVRFRSYTEPKIWGNTDNDYYVIDMTHPDAYAYIRGVFESLKKYGFKLYKTDFLLWGMQDSSEVVRYDNSRTSVMVMRDTLAMIRSVIGEDAYFLSSIAPFMPCIGFMDGMRIASDMGAQWTKGHLALQIFCRNSRMTTISITNSGRTIPMPSYSETSGHILQKMRHGVWLSFRLSREALSQPPILLKSFRLTG